MPLMLFSRPASAQAPDQRLEDAAAMLLERRRGKPVSPGAPRAGGAVRALVKPLIPQGPATLNDLKQVWEEIVGERLAKLTEPEKLTKTTLTIRCHASAAPFVQHQEKLILERVRLAGGAAESLSIKQVPLTAKAGNVRPVARSLAREEEAALAAALSAIRHDPLRAALLRLGRAVAAG